ncbi:MAG TPA: hypothetical protein EYH01_06745 [Campylobacterales bacterium]|nr:hypothetical protein [Campylobacterales bacterium]
MGLEECVKDIKYKNKTVEIYVNEVEILITRVAYKERKEDDGTISKKRIKREPVKARFVV